MDIEEYVPATEAADLLGLTTGRVRQLLRDGALKGQKVGPRAWLVEKKSVAAYAVREKTSGRPSSSVPKI